MQKMIRIGFLLILCFMNMNMSYASPQSFQETQNWWALIRCAQCQQAKQQAQNLDQGRCPPGPSGPTITRLFAYGAAYDNETATASVIVQPGEALKYNIYSTSTRLTVDPNQVVNIEESGDYLIKFTVSVSEFIPSNVYVGLELNGNLVRPSVTTVRMPGALNLPTAYTVAGQVMLSLAAGDQLRLTVPQFSPEPIFEIFSTSAANQPSLHTTLSVEKLN